MKNSIDPAPESHSVNKTEQNINAQETTNSNNEVMKEKNAVQVSTPNDIPTALDANEQATTAGSPVDKIANQASVIPIGLDPRRIYTWDELSSHGFKKAGLRNNREVNDKVVKKKMMSIKRTNGVISPILVVSARACLEQGLEVVDENGNQLSLDDPDIDSYLVIIDGLHRDEAVTRLNLERKQDERPYDLPVIFPQIERPKVLTMLGESNISTRPWKGTDYLVSLLNSGNLPGVNKEVTETLELVKKYSTEGCSEIAAWGYATGTYKRQPTANRLYKAQSDVETRNRLTEGSNKYGREIYDTLKTAGLDSRMIGSKEVSKYLIEKMHDLVADGTTTLKDAANVITKFIGSLTQGEVTAINQSAGKTEEVDGVPHKFSRYDVARSTIHQLFEEYQNKE